MLTKGRYYVSKATLSSWGVLHWCRARWRQALSRSTVCRSGDADTVKRPEVTWPGQGLGGDFLWLEHDRAGAKACLGSDVRRALHACSQLNGRNHVRMDRRARQRC